MKAWTREATLPPGAAALALRATPSGTAAAPGGRVDAPPTGSPAARSGAGGLRPPRPAPPTPIAERSGAGGLRPPRPAPPAPTNN
jgi:hypothetical protein